MDENDTILIQDLADSFSRQLQWYRQLRDLVRKILGRLVLSRGDTSGVITGFEQKKALLEKIEDERNRSAGLVERWQSRKGLIGAEEKSAMLEDVLEQTGRAIQEFLDEEKQLEKYLESIIKKEERGAVR
ncbi:MAG TPA: hypothetical protein PLE24_05560 [Chitinispirillaceae bacterium]|jgi:hypothetical protein|nr:hypothetical protein [Chitinispirillaceae bacterium]